MTSNPKGLRSDKAICHFINTDQPRQDLIKSNLILTHKILERKKPEQILNQIVFPSRSCGQVRIRDYPQSERAKRSPLAAGLRLYIAIPQDFKVLPNKILKQKLRKIEINYPLFK